jgi:peroxiredoxin
VKIKTNKNIKILALIIISLSLSFLLSFYGCGIETPLKTNDNSKEPAENISVVENQQESTVLQDSSYTSESKIYVDDFTLIDLDGNEVSLHFYQDKIVVINFWTTWCPPCQAEIPDFVEVSNIYKAKGVQFLGISNDFDKSLKAFEQQYKINYPTLLDNTKEKVFSKWGIKAIPHTFIIGKNGEILFEQTGMIKKEQLIDLIEAALQVKY